MPSIAPIRTASTPFGPPLLFCADREAVGDQGARRAAVARAITETDAIDIEREVAVRAHARDAVPGGERERVGGPGLVLRADAAVKVVMGIVAIDEHADVRRDEVAVEHRLARAVGRRVGVDAHPVFSLGEDAADRAVHRDVDLAVGRQARGAAQRARDARDVGQLRRHRRRAFLGQRGGKRRLIEREAQPQVRVVARADAPQVRRRASIVASGALLRPPRRRPRRSCARRRRGSRTPRSRARARPRAAFLIVAYRRAVARWRRASPASRACRDGPRGPAGRRDPVQTARRRRRVRAAQAALKLHPHRCGSRLRWM